VLDLSKSVLFDKGAFFLFTFNLLPFGAYKELKTNKNGHMSV